MFALGATIASVATGRPPYGGGDWQAVSYRVVHGEIDVDGVQPELAQLISECVTRDPERRPSLAEIVRRSRVSGTLADNQDYQTLAAWTVEAPADLQTAIAAGLVPTRREAETNQGHATLTASQRQLAPTLSAPVSPPRRRTALTIAVILAATVILGAAAVMWWRHNGNLASDQRTVTPTTSPSMAPTTSIATDRSGRSTGTSQPGGQTTARPQTRLSSPAAPPQLGSDFLTGEWWNPGSGYCMQPPEERVGFDFQYSVGPDLTEGIAQIGFRDKFNTLKKSGKLYFVAAAVRPPSAQRGNSNVVPAFVSATYDLSTADDWLDITYPYDFPGAVPVANHPGAWTVVFYHVTTAQDYASIACGGFSVP